MYHVPNLLLVLIGICYLCVYVCVCMNCFKDHSINQSSHISEVYVI